MKNWVPVPRCGSQCAWKSNGGSTMKGDKCVWQANWSYVARFSITWHLNWPLKVGIQYASDSQMFRCWDLSIDVPGCAGMLSGGPRGLFWVMPGWQPTQLASRDLRRGHEVAGSDIVCRHNFWFDQKSHPVTSMEADKNPEEATRTSKSILAPLGTSEQAKITWACVLPVGHDSQFGKCCNRYLSFPVWKCVIWNMSEQAFDF